jgi:DNA-binding NtrC family response regulator
MVADSIQETERLSRQLYGALARADDGQGNIALYMYHRDGVDRLPLFPGRSWVIGREPPSDIVVRDSSVSRQHARLTAGTAGQLFIDDLDSTNGCFINGVSVERGEACIGDQVTLGGVTLVLHLTDGAESQPVALQSHDAFLIRVAEELARAQTFGRQFALLMLRADAPDRRHVSRWVGQLSSQLRVIDRLGLYASDCVEVLLPETGAAAGRERAEALVNALETVGPVVAVGVFPDHATTVGALIARCRKALQADAASAVRTVPDPSGAVQTDDATGEATSPAMQEVHGLADRVAPSAVAVLIQGETGTGKEVLSRRIHAKSGRSGPFCAVNCGGLSPQLVESTLFGHEKGAFTGADERRQGVLEASSSGTILLDEIGELPTGAQASLLRALDTKRITRVGSTHEIPVDLRVLAATNRDLEQMVREGSFRQDLLFRLNTVVLKIPPLRERRGEIEPLVQQFAAEAARANRRPKPQIDPDALTQLESHHWPGNVRELRNVVERAVVICQEELITREDLPSHLRGSFIGATVETLPVSSGAMAEGLDFKSLVQRYECGLIIDALRACDWNQSEVARRLQIPRRTLVHKMKAMGIRKLGFGVETGEEGRG